MGILGVDPGLSGGLAIRAKEGLIYEPMPVVGGEIDLAALTRWLRAHRDEIEVALIEKVSAMPKQGVSSTFKFGDGFGSIKGILTALGIPFELVGPQKWMRVMHAGIKPDLPSKARSQLAASRIFPAISFLATARSRVPHEGMVEASLIAEYGWRSKVGQQEGVAQ
jgi:crossover junction endodeoxyribonuclease RuvC